MGAEVKLTDNSELFKNASEEAIERALEAIGIQAEGHAKQMITSSGAIDTGLLRNSITHAISGEPAAIDSYSGDRPSKYKKNGDIPEGSYNGVAPKAPRGQKAVYIGTNVEYAPYVEYGTSRMKARPFIIPAASSHGEEYRAIVEQELKKG